MNPTAAGLAALSAKIHDMFPWSEWEGQCHAVATLAAQVHPNLRVRRGMWLGPILEKSRFYGRPFTQHSWCVLTGNNPAILDPTRVFFRHGYSGGPVELVLVNPGDPDYQHYDTFALRTSYRFNRAPGELTRGDELGVLLDTETEKEITALLGREKPWGRWELGWIVKHPDLTEGGRRQLVLALEQKGAGALVPIDIHKWVHE